MKQTCLIFLIIHLSLGGCANKRKDSELAHYTSSHDMSYRGKTEHGIGKWVKEGGECYGIVTVVNNNGAVVAGSPIKVKTIIILPNEIKLKALESIDFGKHSECDQMKVDQGDTWWEDDGELFQTKQEVFTYLEQKFNLKKSNNKLYTNLN